jgi:hypothetical protein
VRRSQHFLADTFDPEPWLALALTRPLAVDVDVDRAIVEDALRAMCLSTELRAGSFRTRMRVPDAAIDIDAVVARVTTPASGVDTVAPRYWLPPAVAAAIRARGHAGYELYLGSADVIPRVAATCATAHHRRTSRSFAAPDQHVW